MPETAERTAERERAADGPFDDYGSANPEWLHIDWRELRHSVDVAGSRVGYVEMGEGPPLVLVHGLSGCWQNWLENIPHLARRHRVVALDLPGFGTSPMPDWDISIPAFGRLLRDFCEKLGIARAVIVGNSMGGFIATEVAIAEAERVSKLVLVSAAGVTYAGLRREPFAVGARMAAALAPLAFRLQREGIHRRRLRRLAFQGVVYSPNRLRAELLWEFTVPALTAPGFIHAMENLAGYDIRDRLVEIEDPALIVWGHNDRVVPVSAAHEYERLIGENARKVIWDKTGHLPMLERPARFNALLDEFLAG
jgi:pimeloyl-ACP methyl ester carboxylesterase